MQCVMMREAIKTLSVVVHFWYTANMKSAVSDMDREQAFYRIAQSAKKLLPLFPEGERAALAKAVDLLEHKVIPLLRHECPLLVAVTGGGSVGKSTLFNLFAGGKFSGVKSRAGYTRRTLAAIHPSVVRDKARMELLFDVFKKNALPARLKSPDEVLEPGNPLYVESANIPESLAFLDTPDFDTGTGDAYANREAAAEILAASDVLVYIFTNQTYNNLANTEFVRSAISNIGRRKLVLIYRCSAAYPDDEVWEHMDAVLRNLFPGAANPRSESLGFYRVDESDAVVRGEAPAIVRPMQGGCDFGSLLAGLDVAGTRKEILRAQIESILAAMKAALENSGIRCAELVAWRDALKVAASHAVLDSLKNFPQGMLMERFMKCWRAAQPGYVRAAHWSGRKLEQMANWVKRKVSKDCGEAAPGRPAMEEYAKCLHDDVKESAGKLRATLNQSPLTLEFADTAGEAQELRKALDSLAAHHVPGYDIAHFGKGKARCTVPRPGMLQPALDKAIEAATTSFDDGWIDGVVKTVCQDNDITPGIQRVVEETRREMGFWEKSKEGLWAAAATLPPVLAAAWVFCTSEPVVGAGIMAHVTALFGLGDLWATVAIPVSLGLDGAHKRFLENALKGLYEAWLNKKCEPVRSQIEANITGPCRAGCDDLLDKIDVPLKCLAEAVEKIEAEGEAA